MREKRDAALADLVGALGLHWPAGLDAWEERLRNTLETEVYAEYLEHRMGCALGPDAASFYEFVGRHVELALLMQEGRLDYHSAVLSSVADAVAAGPHDSILDLGCNCGLTTQYLARRFPQSRIVGIDNGAGLVEAAHLLCAKAGSTNAEFVCGDYTQYESQWLFDAVVSLHTMPVYFLPFVPSEQPENYRRGETLVALAADPVLPHRRVGRSLAAARRLLSHQGRLVLHERLHSLPQILLFAMLAAKAGLFVCGMDSLGWETPSEVKPGRHTSPLIVAEARTPPAEFAEEQVIDLFQPPAHTLPVPPAPGSNTMGTVTGPLAQQAFRAMTSSGRSLCIRSTTPSGRRRHVYLGITESKLAFSYACDTFDSRELKLADVRHAQPLFAAEVDGIARTIRAGNMAFLEPGLEKLPSLLSAILR